MSKNDRFEGLRTQRIALRSGLEFLHSKGESDQRISDVLADYLSGNKIPNYPKGSLRKVSRPTIQRIRTSSDSELIGIRLSTIGVLYSFLCHCEELKTPLFNSSTRIHSAHELAPLLEALNRLVGATEGPLNNFKMKSLEGVFHLYRKAWTSPDAQAFIRCIVRFDWVGDAMFYTEEQVYFDTVEELPVDETDTGLVFPFGMNVVLLGRGNEKDLLKFFSIDDFSTHPDGHQKVHWFSGNFIAVNGKGPHPGFRAYAKRVKPDEEASTKFYAPNELDPVIAKRLED